MPDAVAPSLVSVLVLAVTTLSGVVVYLWRYYSGKVDKLESELRSSGKAHAEEREKWAVERTQLNGFRDQTRAEYAQRYADDLRKLYAEARERDDQVRRENAANAEALAARAAEERAKIGDALTKLAEWAAGNRPRKSY